MIAAIFNNNHALLKTPILDDDERYDFKIALSLHQSLIDPLKERLEKKNKIISFDAQKKPQEANCSVTIYPKNDDRIYLGYNQAQWRQELSNYNSRAISSYYPSHTNKKFRKKLSSILDSFCAMNELISKGDCIVEQNKNSNRYILKEHGHMYPYSHQLSILWRHLPLIAKIAGIRYHPEILELYFSNNRPITEIRTWMVPRALTEYSPRMKEYMQGRKGLRNIDAWWKFSVENLNECFEQILPLFISIFFQFDSIQKMSFPGNKDDRCLECLEQAKEFPIEQKALTQCCQQFLCASDGNRIIAKAKKIYELSQKADEDQEFLKTICHSQYLPDTSDASCPACNHKPLALMTLKQMQQVEFDTIMHAKPSSEVESILRISQSLDMPALTEMLAAHQEKRKK